MTQSVSQSKTPFEFKVRQMKFNFPDRIPKYWVNNNPFHTFFMAAMSMMFSPGETLVVEGVRNYRHSEKITDPKLKKEIGAFIGQEGFHSREHDRFNELTYQHFKFLAHVMSLMQWAVQILLKILPNRMWVAFSAATEHLTATFARYVLKYKNSAELMAMQPSEVKELWIWHAIEEMEHKAVCFDTEVAVSNSYWLRVFCLLFATSLALGVVFLINMYMIVTEGLLFRGDLWKQELHHLWNRENGFFGSMISGWLEFFRHDFHPWDDKEDLELLQQMQPY